MRVLLIFFSLFILTSSYKHSFKGPLSNLIASAGFPSCIIGCSSNLLEELDDVFVQPFSTPLFERICKSYRTSRSCVTASPKCLLNSELYDDLTSGIRYACNDEYEAFRSFLPCIKVFVTEKRESLDGDCESTCRLNDSLTDLMMSKPVQLSIIRGSNGIDILKHAGTTCKSLSCYLKCIRRDFNKYCGSSGSKVVEMVVRPLDVLSRQIRDNSNNIDSIFRNAIPSDCRQFVIPKLLDEIRFDEDFLAKMRILLATRMRQQISSNYVEGEKIIKELLLPKVKRDEPRNHGWDLVAITYMFLMISILLLNVVALFAVLWWCCKSAAEDKAARHLADNTMDVKFSLDSESSN
ncbi:unnamed protein product [Auanema sp. JU1783]|nr:unnamed protein product [Auanema sp. JU1783]